MLEFGAGFAYIQQNNFTFAKNLFTLNDKPIILRENSFVRRIWNH
jgi:hypothetical protein